MDNLIQMLDHAADGAFIIDEGQRIVYWNQAAQDILGYSPAEVIGQTCYTIIQGCNDQNEAICRHHCHVTIASMAGRPVVNYDVAAQTRWGQSRWINISILATLMSAEHSKTLIVHLFRDATRAKQSEQFIHQVLEAASQLATQPPPGPPTPEPGRIDKGLTPREREVLGLLVRGLNTSDIAESLSISPSTARNHIQNILHKLQVHSRLEAVAYALEHGLIARP